MSDHTDDRGECLDDIFRTLTPRIAQFTRRLVGRLPSGMSDDPEEVVQTVFLKVLESMRAGKCTDTHTEPPYLLAITRNATWDLLRSRKRSVFVAAVGDEIFDGRGADLFPETLLCALQEYTASLPPKLTTVFALRFARGCSQAHTCRAMAISRQSLRTLEARLKEGALRVVEHLLLT